MSSTGPEAWTLVVPVKDGRVAKSRLAHFAGARRPDLARAMAGDCVAAALACPLVGSVVVVTDDVAVAELARGLAARVVPDQPRSGLNAALLHGAKAALSSEPRQSVGALSSDLPALRPAELAMALRTGASLGRSFVADAAGTGTTLLLATNGASLLPAFGPGSAAAHRLSGATEIEQVGLSSLRQDVDTGADLHAAARIGLGPRTRAVLAELEVPACRS